jgi:hypothetical protein
VSQISGAQQWIDDLDELDDLDSDGRETRELTFPTQSDTGIPLHALVDASLGTGEVTAYDLFHLLKDESARKGLHASFMRGLIRPAKGLLIGIRSS